MNDTILSEPRRFKHLSGKQSNKKRLKTTATYLAQVQLSSTTNSMDIGLKGDTILDPLSNYLSALELRAIHPECENQLVLCTLSLAFCLTKERPIREPEEFMVKALLDNGSLAGDFISQETSNLLK